MGTPLGDCRRNAGRPGCDWRPGLPVSIFIVADWGKLSAKKGREQGTALLAVSDLRGIYPVMIRKLKSGEFRLYSRKKDASTGKRRNLGTFASLEKAKQHEREVQYFKKH